ncbi:MAG: bifunctional riboflavin kinase/FAD synthetase [Pirellulaceae bacterium]
MQRIRHIDELPAVDRSGALAIGNFDGVHLGHARIISRLVARAASLDGPSVVFTFDPHPASLLRPQQVSERLVTVDRKLELLEQLGVDVVVVYPTDKQFLELSAEAFFETIVLAGLDARVIVEGTNFSFGRDREGTIEKLETLCRQHQVQLELVRPVELDGDVVSSSRLRQLISRGDLETVNRMLTSPYRVRGRIQQGSGRGQELGFPTANLGELATLLPADGVYAGCGYIDGTSWPAAVNIGGNPTFEDPTAKFEVHLVGFSGSRYGEMIDIELLTRLRDVRRFEDPEQLCSQIEEDVQQAREVAGEVPGNLDK